MKNILLTGGAGYIGSHVANYLLDKGSKVTIIDNLSTGYKYLIPKKSKFFKCDIADTKKVTEIIKNNNSQILNCGYGKGYSVLEVVKNINLYLKKKIPITFGKRRYKDIMTSISDTKKFNKFIKWKPKYNNLKYILKSSYEWEKNQNYKE